MNRGAVRILVLGDSTLSSLGGQFRNAVDVLLDASYAAPVEIVNVSVAGLTSADAELHFAELARSERFDAVVVYVGNCDACGYGSPRVFAPLGLARLVTRLRVRRGHARRAEPFRLGEPAAPAARSVSPADYGRFLAALVKRAERAGTKLLLVNPAPKRRFPPCNNTGNFSFYKVAGIEDDPPLRAGPGAEALLEALALHGAGSLEAALAAYERVRAAGGGEPAQIAANNAAAIHFREGRSDAALGLLRSIPASSALHPLALFNQAIVLGSDELFAEATERDTGSYRVTEAYRRELARLGPALDADALLSDADFLDYCHPGIEGHERLGREIRLQLEQALGLEPGRERPVLRCAPVNPERFGGDRRGLFAQLGVVGAADPGLAGALAERASQPYADVLGCWDRLDAGPRERARRRILAHPLFGAGQLLALSPPAEGVDQGSLPELYFLRHMLPLHRLRLQSDSLRAAFHCCDELLARPERIDPWWGALGVPEVAAERLAQMARVLDLEQVLQRAAERLRHSLGRGPLVYARYRTITYWFLRESLVFGSASHFSMYFDRAALVDALDAGLFGLAFLPAESSLAKRFAALARAAGESLAAHRAHLAPVAHEPFRMGPEAFARYRSELERIAASSALATR